MDVKRIFFEEGINSPFFEMDNGEIKRPTFKSVVNGLGSTTRVNAGYWTEKEMDEYNKKQNTPPPKRTFIQKIKDLV